MKFITREELDRISNTSNGEELLNEILTRVYNAAVEAAIRKLPEVVSRMVSNTSATQAMTKDFFNRNKIFEDHKDIVRSVIQDVESQHPEWDYAKILEASASIINDKIKIDPKQIDLPLDKPAIVNLDGNGVL